MEEYIYKSFCVLAAIIGVCFGSFANVLIYRIPRGESIIWGGSHCTSCGKPIKFYDNIPILSYLILGGKCRYCKERISPRYIIVESAFLVVWLVIALCVPVYDYAYAVLSFGFATCVIVVGIIDFECGYIFDRFNIAILVFGVLACFLDDYVTWQSRLWGFGFGLLFFGGAYLVSRIVLGKEGLGLGDVKFTASCGLFLGIKATFFGVLVSTTVAAIVLTILSARNKKLNKPDSAENNSDPENEAQRRNSAEYPFAPFLSAGFLLAAICGNVLVDVYLGLF